jgi:N6-adenosine-specific RNA methylase IME4
MNRTGKVAPEHKRLSRYETMSVEEICALPVSDAMADKSHCYLWVPNALLAEGLQVMKAWGFTYKANLVWHKVRKDGGSDGRGVGFYFRNVTELVLFGTRGNFRTLAPARSQVNLLGTRKREHSRKPDELYPIIEQCSSGPYLELFARYPRTGWDVWGNESAEDVVPRGKQHLGYQGDQEGCSATSSIVSPLRTDSGASATTSRSASANESRRFDKSQPRSPAIRRSDHSPRSLWPSSTKRA